MSDLPRLFLDNLLPIFLMAGAGFLLGKTLNIEPQTISRVIFYIFSPCLIFNLLVNSQLSNGDISRMVGYAAVHMLSLALLAWLVSKVLKLDRHLLVAVVLTVMLPNAGNYGLSVNKFAFGDNTLAFASLYFVTSAILANTVGVFIASLGRSSMKKALLGLFKIPMIYAVILAFVFMGFKWSLPVPLERSVSTLANAAIPSMLILLGLQLQKANWTGQRLALSMVAGLRLVVSIGAGIFLGKLFGLSGSGFQAGILEGAMPTAVVSTVLATEFDIEPAFVTYGVFATTLLSPVTLTPLLAFLGG